MSEVVEGNPNSNANHSYDGTVATIITSLFIFFAIQITFECNRFYKQIYMKRLQKRFEEIGRVPPLPPPHIFGWLSASMKISEMDVLRMVGLDAYMLLRYHVICYKLSLFMSFWGLLILVPLYASATGEDQWEKYTLSNVFSSPDFTGVKLWGAAIFGYVFTAYFCQLLYAEYNNFSVRRLQFLVQVDPDSPQADPDTPQQKYFSIMVERIPAHLRSAEALRKFFDNLFPGEVYNVEIALDLKELDSLSNERKTARDRLEKAIAHYEATNVRPRVLIKRKGLLLSDNTTLGITIPSHTWVTFVQGIIAPEYFGFEEIDALNYYTNLLQELNRKMEDLQAQNFDFAKKQDKDLEKRLRNRVDTRAAIAVERLAARGVEARKMLEKAKKDTREGGLESWFFGPQGRDYKDVEREEMNHIAVLRQEDKKHSLQPLKQQPQQQQPQQQGRRQSGVSVSDDATVIGAVASVEVSEGLHANRTSGFDGDIDRGYDLGHREEDSSSPDRDGYVAIEINPDEGEKKSSSPVASSFGEDATANKGKLIRSFPARRPNSILKDPLGLDQFELEFDSIVGDMRGDTTVNPILSLATVGGTQPEEQHQSAANASDGVPSSVSGNISGESRLLSRLREAMVGHGISPSNSQEGGMLDSGFISQEQKEAANVLATRVTREGWAQTKLAGSGALRGVMELERALEMLTLGAYYKFSTTAFVTFNSRVTESIAHQMMLSHDSMEISHAPNPKDVLWENVAIPKSQIVMRSFITNVGLTIGSLFWSSFVNWCDSVSVVLGFPKFQQQYFSLLIILGFLFSLPVFFDALARYYEGLKLESEIQNSIMLRYFYYQLVNIYVTVGLGSENIITQLWKTLRDPQMLVDLFRVSLPAVSLYFFCLMMVKIFVAVPGEMARPYQLSTILSISHCIDRRKCTRRELRTGVFFAWPMLYGWVYPQLVMVLMIQCTYACIAPLIMPLCALFYVFTYVMYKYQLLYVYINDYQSGGYMWYEVFRQSLIALMFASVTLLGFLSLELRTTTLAGAFYFLIPLPFCIWYFWLHCEHKFKRQSMELSLSFAKELDHRNNERRAAKKPVPHDFFTKHCYRQPSLMEKPVYPEPYREGATYQYLRELVENNLTGEHTHSYEDYRARRGSVSIDIHDSIEESEDVESLLVTYFDEIVIPLSIVPEEGAGPETKLREDEEAAVEAAGRQRR